MSQRRTLTYPSADGRHTIRAVEWLPDGTPRGVLQIVHGIAEHMGRYAHVAEFFTRRGYVVCGEDHLGHGATVTDGKYGFFAPEGGWDLVVRDVYALRRLEGERWPDLPYVLLETWNAMGKKRFAPEDQARDRLQRVVTRPVVSVMSKVVYVMRKVYHDEHVYLGALYADIRERSARVALFLAVLELTKHGRIGISEDGTYLYRRTDYRRKHGAETRADAESAVMV